MNFSPKTPKPGARCARPARGLKGGLLMVTLLGAVGVQAGEGALLPSVGPDYRPPSLSLPETWRMNGAVSARLQAASERLPDDQAQIQRQWWHQFGDATLDRLINEALSGSLDLKTAQSRLRQARASLDQAGAAYFPTLEASASGTHSKPSRAMSAAPTSTTYQAGFDASWEIDLFGGTRRAVEAANADLASRVASVDDARITLLAEVAKNYMDLRAYQWRLRIARKNLESQDETLQITRWRNQAGLVGQSDVDQALTSREQTRATLADLQIGVSTAENRLAVLLGQAPGQLQARLAVAPDESLTDPLPPLPAQVGVEIPARVLAQRPDLRAAERTLAAETARLGQAQAKRYPSLNLGGSFGWQGYAFSALGGPSTLARSLTGTLAATLFDGGKLRAAVQVQSAVQEQALLAYQASVLNALEEVENALQAYALAFERAEARRTAAEAARSAAELTRNQYQAGLADFQKVLETERTRLSAEDSLATASATQRTSLIALYKALGGAWDEADTADKAAPEASSAPTGKQKN